MSKLQTVVELWDFLKVSKRWWLLPAVILLLLLGIMVVIAEGSALAPFVYTLF